MSPGGKGANQAVAAARLGAAVVFVARVGDDAFGRQAVNGFEEDGIDTHGIVVDKEKPSGVATITVDSTGQNCIVVASGANDSLSPDDVDRAMENEVGSGVVLLQLETPLETVEHAAKVGHRRGNIVILNPAPARQLPGGLLENVDFLTPNETEAEILSGVPVVDSQSARLAASVLREKGARSVIVTMGAAGAFVSDDLFTGMIPARSVDAVDTTGAGDVFNGALAVAIAEGKDVVCAVRFASLSAAASVMKFGAQWSAPSREEISRLFPDAG